MMATAELDNNTLEDARAPEEPLPTMIERDTYQPMKTRRKCPIPEPVRSNLMPPKTCRQWGNFLLLRLPILSWFWSYKPRYLIGDIIAGITVSVMHIPQGLAYALLANLPPIYGLYTSFMAPIVYAIFGTSRHLALGTFAVVSLMVGNAVQRLVDSNGIPCLEETDSYISNGNYTIVNYTNSSDLVICENFKRDVAVTLAFTSGITLLAMSIFQLGFVSLFLSSALVSGYTTGAAVHVATSQVHHLLDIPKVNNSVPPGVLNVPKTWISIAQNVTQGNVNVATIIVSLISIIFLVIIRNVNLCWAKTKVYKKIPIPIPAQLILIIFATVISYFVGLNTRWNVSIVNKIAGGPPPFSVPVVEHISSLIQDAITIAVVTFAISVSLSQVFAKRNKYEISSNQELFAYGITSVCNSFFSGYSPSGSLSRSVVQETTGGKTQLVGLISSSILLAVIYVVAPLFEPLPKAILSSIVIVALYGMFKQLLHLYKYWKLSKVDFLVWIVVFLATFLLGVDLGLLVGVIFSLAMVIIRILLPIVTVLGIESSKDNEDNEVEVFALPGILILRYYAPICYLNAGVFQTTLRQKAQFDPPKADIGVGCWKAAYLKIKHLNTPSNNNQKSSNSLEFVSEPQTPTSITGSVSLAANQQINMCLIESINGQDLSITANHISVGIGSTGSNEMVHTIIIDCSAISFVDSVGTEVLEQIVADYDEAQVQVLFAASPNHVVTMFERTGFVKRFGQSWFFPSIASAVKFVQSGGRLTRVKEDESEPTSSESVQQVVDGNIVAAVELNEPHATVEAASDSNEDPKVNDSKSPFIRLRRYFEARL